MNIKEIVKQALSFFVVSGIGWIIDFAIYIILTSIVNFPIAYANFISAIPAITYVFIISNKKIFNSKNSKYTIKQKYIFYFLYQIILVAVVSSLGQFLYHVYMNSKYIDISFLFDKIKILIKIIITPITMLLNFVVMKSIIEKL